MLEDPATRAAVRNSYDSAVEAARDDDSPQRLADAVLGLLAALDVAPGEYPWLAELALPGLDGDWYPAGELLLPGSPLAAIIASDAPFGTADQDLVARHGTGALLAAGVLSVLRPPDARKTSSSGSPGSTWTWTASTSGPPTPGNGCGQPGTPGRRCRRSPSS